MSDQQNQEDAEAELAEINKALPRCRSCKFFVPVISPSFGMKPPIPMGRCQFNAPANGPHGSSIWPIVSNIMFCGQHKERS